MENPEISPYFIEIRIVGRLKYDIVNVTNSLNKRFHIDTSKMVPHIRLVGPFKTDDEERLIKDFEQTCSKMPLIKYKINDFESFDSTSVLYLNVEDDEDIELFRLELNDQLRDYCRLSYWDLLSVYKLHITLAIGVNNNLMNAIISHMKKHKPFVYEYPLLRVSLLKAGRILCEYDFAEEYLYDYRNPSNIQRSREGIAQYFQMVNEVRQLTPQIFFTSDLHFCDVNALCDYYRPFCDINEMNMALVYNWNAIVTPVDTVYCLGDFTYYGCDQIIFDTWLSKLNGNIVFIRGNHDEHIISDKVSFVDNVTLDIGDQKIYMIHNPKHVPEYIKNNKNYWIMHGHLHNKLLNIYPFLDRVSRYINVSIDVTHYRPVSLKEIINLINIEKNEQNEVILDIKQTDYWIRAN